MKHSGGTKLRLLAVTIGAMALSVAAVAWASPVTLPNADSPTSQPIKLDVAGNAFNWDLVKG